MSYLIVSKNIKPILKMPKNKSEKKIANSKKLKNLLSRFTTNFEKRRKSFKKPFSRFSNRTASSFNYIKTSKRVKKTSKTNKKNL